ncbi:MAG: alkaline phosphatase family protein, partial [Planctomycetota bacterium]
MAKRLAKKILLVGWDGADWQVILPLMENGQMPNLQKIVCEGVMGNLASMQPMISPMLWTTMATGKPPHRHGICGFTEPDPNSPTGRKVTGSTSRKCKAFWNILSQSNIPNHVVGWYA